MLVIPNAVSPPISVLSGVGKSTFVEALGLNVLQEGEESQCFRPEKIAVLCIDPSSHVTGGSILGDKTRMTQLSRHPQVIHSFFASACIPVRLLSDHFMSHILCHAQAYVRPSPSSGALGGLGSYTYDAASLCELAGYQLTIIETVGVGQSEVELRHCCDLFLLMLAPGGGDELQGFKKGIVEAADVLVVNKADGDLQTMARQTANGYKRALGLLRKPAGWQGGGPRHESEDRIPSGEGPTPPPVLLVSAKTGWGMPELWKTIMQYHHRAKSSGHHSEKRMKQNRYVFMICL